MLHNSEERGKSCKARFHKAKTSLHLSRGKWQVIWLRVTFSRGNCQGNQAIMRIFKDWHGKDPRQQSNISLCVILMGTGRTRRTTFYLWEVRSSVRAIQESALTTEQTEGLGIGFGVNISGPTSSRNGWAIYAPHSQQWCENNCF